MRLDIQQLIKNIQPLDNIEQDHIDDSIEWIDSGEEIFRIEKPDIPPKHLVSYFVLVDIAVKKLLLLDHIKAELWLPSGGHVEKNEHPKTTVEREIGEELNLKADFVSPVPFFITQAVTVGKTAGHTDVSLWYLLRGDSSQPVNYEQGEFNGYKWFKFKEILEEESKIFDPHMQRFTKKLLVSNLIK